MSALLVTRGDKGITVIIGAYSFSTTASSLRVILHTLPDSQENNK
jgi:hypothetical protein